MTTSPSRGTPQFVLVELTSHAMNPHYLQLYQSELGENYEFPLFESQAEAEAYLERHYHRLQRPRPRNFVILPLYQVQGA